MSSTTVSSRPLCSTSVPPDAERIYVGKEPGRAPVATARHRTAAGGTRPRRRDRRAPQGRRPVRLRTGRRRGRGVRRGRDPVRGRAGCVRGRGRPRRGRDPGDPSGCGPFVRGRHRFDRARRRSRSLPRRGCRHAGDPDGGRPPRRRRAPTSSRPAAPRTSPPRSSSGRGRRTSGRSSGRSRTSRSSPKRRASAHRRRSSSVPSQRFRDRSDRPPRHATTRPSFGMLRRPSRGRLPATRRSRP